MLRNARILVCALLVTLLWAGSAQAYLKYTIKSQGAALDKAYIEKITTFISDIHKCFIHALRLRLTSNEHVSLMFFQDESAYNKIAFREIPKYIKRTPLAFYDPTKQEIWTMDSPDRNELTRRILHESCHMFLDSMTEEIPTWLDEGLAQSFQSPSLYRGRFFLNPSGRDRHAKKLLAQGRLPALHTLLDLDYKAFHSGGDHESEMYTVSFSLAWFLLSSPEGRQLLNDLIRAHQSGRRIEPSSVLVDRYWRGGTKALEAAWRAWIPDQRAAMPLDIPNPGEPSLTTIIR